MKIPERSQRDDLLRALAGSAALDRFQALPLEDQDRFWAWIAKSRDEEAYWRRIDILVIAMRVAPPSTPRPQPRAMPGPWIDPQR